MSFLWLNWFQLCYSLKDAKASLATQFWKKSTLKTTFYGFSNVASIVVQKIQEMKRPRDLLAANLAPREDAHKIAGYFCTGIADGVTVAIVVTLLSKFRQKSQGPYRLACTRKIGHETYPRRFLSHS